MEEEKTLSLGEGISDLKQIFKSGMLVGVGNVFQLIVRYITNVIITRTVGAEVYGFFNLALTITNWFTLFLPFGLPVAVYRYVPKFMAEKRFQDAQHLARTSFYGLLFAGLLAGIVLLLFSEKIAVEIYSEPRLIPVLRILSITCLFVSSVICVQLLVAIRRVDVQVGIFYFFAPVLRFVLVVILFLAGLRLYALIFSHIAISFFVFVLVVCYSWFLFFRRKYKDGKPRGISWSEIIRFSFPMFLANVAIGLVGIVDISILGLYVPSKDIGIYTIGQRLSVFIVFSLSAFNTLYAPILSEFFTKGEREKLESTYRTVAGWSLLGGFFLMGIFLFAGKELLSIFGSEFKEGYQALLILSLGQIINAGTGSVGWILVMSGYHMYYVIDIVVIVILNVFLNLFLIPKIGMEGAAIATAFVYGGLNVMMLSQVWWKHRLHPFDGYYLRKVIVFLISSGASCILPVLPIIPAFLQHLLVFLILFSALFLLLARSKEDSEIIKAGLRKVGVMR